MNEMYEDKTRENIKDWLTKEFKKIDKFGIRDDQEILGAGINICEQIIEEIKNDKTKIYGTWALEPITKLKIELVNEYNSLKGIGILTKNNDKIHSLANRIDNAENEALKRLKKNRTTQDSRDIVNKGNEAHKEKPMFVMEGGNDVKKQTGNIIFTKESNKVTIEQALKGLFSNPDIVYEIDYSGCTNKEIKERMKKVMGIETCYLRYDKENKTYTIRNKDGDGISDEAPIWEGVKLIPAGVRQWQAYVEQKKTKEKAGNVDNAQTNKLIESMLKDMPSAKELTPEEQKQLVIKTEKRITELLRKAKKLGYEIESECVSRKWAGAGHMELHLISSSSEVDRTIWGNDGSYNKILGEKLDNFIDSNEGEYKTYLTNRVKAKRQELSSLTKTEEVDLKAKGKERVIEIEEKGQILYGIGQFEQMVDAYRETEGESWMDDDDKDLVVIKELINNAKVSIENGDNISKEAIIKNFVNPIWEKWASFKNISKNINRGQGQVYENPKYKEQYNQLMKVFFGKKEEQIIATRNLGTYGRLLDNTETSFLAGEIEGIEGLRVKNEDIQKCLDNIENRTSMSIYDENGNINEEVKGRYDNTYRAAKGGTEGLIRLFVLRGRLPQNWKEEESEVRKCMDGLRDRLNYIDEQCNNVSVSVDATIKSQHERRLKLEQKENKTEDDIKVLQGLIYLDENQDEARKIYEESIEKANEEQRYGELGQIIKGGLLSALGELGGGITGNNEELVNIYNDIKGYGFWNLSDENAKIAKEIVEDIAITVAVGVVTGGMGAGAVATVLCGAAVVANGAKWLNTATKIYKLIRITHTGYKGLSKTAKAIKLGMKATTLSLEGTAFNAVSEIIRSATKGTSLDELNLNPFAIENIKTAAFLGALSIGNQLGMKVLTKLHGRTKIEAFSKAGLQDIIKNHKGVFTESLVTETVAMFGAEQGMNFVFGHDVINPETGEIETTRSLQRPTQQEFTQMIGMILAFKLVRSQLWHKYEQKINEGTIEICRSTMRNGTLLVNTQTGEIINLQDLIEGKENWKKPGSKGKKTKGMKDKEEQQKGKKEEQQKENKEGQQKEKKEETKKEKSKSQNEESSDYFGGKSHQYEVTEAQARSNSEKMDKILSEINEENKSQKLEELRKEISKQYKQATKEDLQLSEEQLLSILDAHEQDGELGNLTIGQLRVKVKILSETITDPRIRRFLLEAGFCGQEISTSSLEGQNLTPEQINNIKTIKDELGIHVTTLDIEYIKDLKLSQSQINNIKQLLQLGVDITAQDLNSIKDITRKQIENTRKIVGIFLPNYVIAPHVNIIKDTELNPEQINNIKFIKDELGIKVSIVEIGYIKDLKLSHNQVKNIKQLLDCGINFVVAGAINKIKDVELTEKQIENIKKIKDLGIHINVTDINDINDIKDIELSEKQINNIKKIKNLFIYIHVRDINDIKDIELTEKQINNIKKIDHIFMLYGEGISATDIKYIKDVELTEKQVDNIKKLCSFCNKIGIYINVKTIDHIKDIELTEKQIENIKEIKDNLGFKLELGHIIEIKDLNISTKQARNIKKIVEEFGISDIAGHEIKHIKDIELTEKQIENIKKLKDELKIKIRAYKIKNIKDIELTEKQIENIKKIKEKLEIKSYGTYVEVIEEIKDIELTERQIENIKKLRDELGIEIKAGNIEECIKIKDMITPELIESTKKIMRELGIEINAGNIEECIKIKDMITPELIESTKKIMRELGINKVFPIDLEIISKNREIFEIDNNKFYEGYGYSKDKIVAHQHYKRGAIIEKIEQYVQEIIPENRDIGEAEINNIINNVRPLLVTLPKAERLYFLRKIYEITEKFNTVRKYLDFENGPYKDRYPNAKILLCAMRGIINQNMIDKITDDITVIQHGTGMTFFVGDRTSYEIICSDELKKSGGFNDESSFIYNLSGTLSVVNGKDPRGNKSSYRYGTIWHEGQHNRNTYFMPDKLDGFITSAKDEITAYLRDGRRNIKQIEYTLTEPKSKGGLYQYGLEGEALETHKAKVRELCGYAEDLINLTKNPKTGLTRDKVISMLSDTPAEGRKDLHSNIMKDVESHRQNNPLLRRIQNLNSNSSNGEEFWRAGTVKKETAINEIKSCKSIDEIKHTLSDPKYSHIGRGPNNKGGIEISAIIDEVIAGRVESDILPLEIRPKIEGFIKK